MSLATDDLDFEATVLEQRTEHHPAKIQLSVTNRSDERITLSGGPILPFTEIKSSHEGDEPELFLIPDKRDWITPTDGDGNPLDVPLIPSTSDGCWTVEYEGTVRSQTMRMQELTPDETISREYTLLAEDDDQCFSSGTYEFVDEQKIRKGEISSDHDEIPIDLKLEVEIRDDKTISIGTETNISSEI